MPPADDAPAPAPPPTPPPARGTAASARVLLQSPPPAFPLGSNDDQLERARARAAARAASVRRRSLAATIAPSKDPRQDLLDREQVMDLFHNCIKLASENKINQKNTWELGLIDHLHEIIQVGEEDDDETNFQKASCTLEAGVKIYSTRVDSVHSEAYKVLGGINRAGRGEEADVEDESNVESAQDEGNSKKDADRRISPASTLESSFEALNVKKFDVAFTVDPLYHQTTTQFDEGGPKGLLLYNLGVYGSCRVLFDSFEAPDKCILSDMQTDSAEMIDLSFCKEIEEMVAQMPGCNDISPTLRDIIALFDEENKRPSHGLSPGQVPVMEDGIVDGNDADNNDSMLPDSESWDFGGCDDHEDAYDENYNPVGSHTMNYQEEFGEYTVEIPQGTVADEKLDKIADLLLLGMGTSKTNAWAGPEHWKYQKVKDLVAAPTSSGESEVPIKMKKKKVKNEPDVDFTKALDNEYLTIFAPPKNPKSLLLPANRAICSNKLPEDCHYQPESLVKFSLLPDVLCWAKRRKSHDTEVENNHDFIPSEPWDDDNFCTDHVDEGHACSDVEESVNLVDKPRQVNKIDIQYDKVSKQVDVHALKEVLWKHIHTSTETDDKQENEEAVSALRLSQVLHDLPSRNPNAAATDISPHLYFICLLHLANEHGLMLRDRPMLDEIDIYVPTSPCHELSYQ
ncbi:condensin complex subunit 2-like isoform X3 [Panicum virgatum]|uniref:condensin complex subunit 2-like isoform X3 n=1 Tax=Panicum virgatum TaxID=38727 RepID=UPI0019D63BB7|nr:condensin complex subunit 2-like isoform X3 [Panicum virgatum]